MITHILEKIFKNNLTITNENINYFEFKKDDIWTNSLKISKKDGFNSNDILNIFFILKSYVNYEIPVVEKIFFILDVPDQNMINFQNRKILININLYKIKKIENLEEFKEWWNDILFKIWEYEKECNDGVKSEIILILNEYNILNKFKKKIDINPFLIKPIYPWKKNILKKLNEKNISILKMKKKLRKDIENFLKKSPIYKESGSKKK